MNVEEFKIESEKHYNYLYAFAFVLTNNRDDALDLVQDTYLHAIERFHLFNKEKSVKGWLRTLLKHLFIDNYRKEKNSLKFKLDYDFDLITVNDCIYNMKEQDAINQIKRFPISHKKILWLRKKGFMYKEISEILGIKVNTVKPYIFRMKQRLKNVIL